MNPAAFAPSTPAEGRRAGVMTRNPTLLEEGLLICGFAAVAHYLIMLVVVPLFWPGYSSASQAVSELSAIGAPSRDLWVPLGRAWAALYTAFGVGVWLAADRQRGLRVVGALIVLSALFGLAWPPMHRREVIAAGGGTTTDTLHIVWTAINGVLTLLAMGLSATTFSSRRFRRGTIVLIAVTVFTGAITGIQSRRLDENLPTPWLGAWERAGMLAWLFWVGMLATALLWRQLHPHDSRPLTTPP